MNDSDLNKIKIRINWFCKNKVNAFSPTISPAPKSMKRNEIESIDKGIRFFYENGVTEFVIQKKYMGSYCDIYLHKNLNETYFVSRNGFKIEHIDLDAAIKACESLHKKMDWENTEMLIIQSELMPWSVLGKRLIEEEFEGYLNAHENHCAFLEKSGIYAKLAQVMETEGYKAFVEDRKKLSGKELNSKYPTHINRQYNSVADFKMLDLKEYRDSIDIYKKQIDHFGLPGEIHFKPFNILKRVLSDGSEVFVNDNLSYTEVNSDDFVHLKIDNEDSLDASIEKVYTWFATQEQEMEEGIIIKPRTAFIKGLPPAFKVRNNKYLTMIYGVNFHQKFNYYLDKRSTKRKQECSVNDWMQNWAILKIAYKDIDEENYMMKNLVLDRILGESVESSLDSRL